MTKKVTTGKGQGPKLSPMVQRNSVGQRNI